jgi:rhodanese-related sulfurtransferase
LTKYPYNWRMRRFVIALAVPALALTVAACGGDTLDPPAAAEAPAAATGGLVDVSTAAAILADAPADLVVLDVRTPEEFAEGHVADATLIDFYEPDFADRIAELDPDVPYVVICRSGNRSSQAVALMRDLRFGDVTDVDGGILAWNAAGLPLAG